MTNETEQTGNGGNPEEEELVSGGKVMSLWDHLSELRTRIVRSAITIIGLFIVAFVFSDQILVFLKDPLASALPPEINSDLHFTGPLDVFITKIKVSFLVAVVFGAPFWLFQFWKFFEPALYPRERKYIVPFAFASSVLFLTGVSFCYTFILPMTLEFLINMGMEVGTPIITITDYISLLMILIFGFGLVFETPVLLVLLALLEIVDAKMLAEYRKFVLVGILVLGAMLTPPDPISQVAMAVPVYLMYEISIVVIRFIKGKGEAGEAAA